MRRSDCAPITHVNTDGTLQVMWSFVAIFITKHLRKKLSVLTEHQTCTVCEGGGGGGGLVEILHDVRRLIRAFVGCKFDKYTNLIRWFKFCMCLQGVKWTIVLLWEREKKMFFYFI